MRRLLEAGRTVMIQPYLDAVDTVGETAVVFIGGAYSHAIRKGPLLVRDVEGDRVEGLFVQERIDPREPSAEQLATAERIVSAIPADPAHLLFARVDLIPDPRGLPAAAGARADRAVVVPGPLGPGRCPARRGDRRLHLRRTDAPPR